MTSHLSPTGKWLTRIAYGLYWFAILLAIVILLASSLLARGNELSTHERGLSILVFWTVLTVMAWTGALFVFVYSRLSEMRDLMASHAVSSTRRLTAVHEPDHRSLN